MIVFDHDTELPPLLAETVRVPVVPDLLNVAVTLDGLGGRVPASYP